MSEKWYTAERADDNWVRFHMPGANFPLVAYNLEPDDARKLRDSLNAALGESGEGASQNLQDRVANLEQERDDAIRQRDRLRAVCLEEAENLRTHVFQTEIDAIERRLRKAGESTEPAPVARPLNAYLVFFLRHEPKPMAAATETAREAAEAFFAANGGLAENYGRSVLVVSNRERTTWSCIRLFGDDAAVFQLDHLGVPKPDQPRINEYWALQKALAAVEEDQVCGECGGQIGDKE